MAKKKKATTPKKKQKSFFESHPNTKWLIPLYFLVTLAAFFML